MVDCWCGAWTDCWKVCLRDDDDDVGRDSVGVGGCACRLVSSLVWLFLVVVVADVVRFESGTDIAMSCSISVAAAFLATVATFSLAVECVLVHAHAQWCR